MRDVAKRSGVSIQTVSAVLNGKPGIGVVTATQVRTAISDLGYQPNLLASSLRSRRSTTIGLLLPNVANPFFAEQARGVEDVAQARGYSVMLCNTDDDPAKEQTYLRLLRQYQAAGVIGGRSASNGSPPHLSPSTMDDQRGGYVATAHLLDLGHRRIGCISGPLPGGPGEERLLGYHAALAEWGVQADDQLLVEGAFDFTSGQRGAAVLLARGVRPTAIFAHNDPMAIGAMATLKNTGLRVPEDVAVMGYDGTEIALLYDPPLTTVIQPTYALGASAMAMLADLIENVVGTADQPPLDCQLIVRRSTVAGLPEERRCAPNATPTPWLDWRRDAPPVTSASPSSDQLIRPAW